MKIQYNNLLIKIQKSEPFSYWKNLVRIFLVWCERRDTALLCRSCILVDPMLRIRYPTSDFEAKNNPPDCFFTLLTLLGFKPLVALRKKIKKQLSSLLATEFWCGCS